MEQMTDLEPRGWRVFCVCTDGVWQVASRARERVGLHRFLCMLGRGQPDACVPYLPFWTVFWGSAYTCGYSCGDIQYLPHKNGADEEQLTQDYK